MRSNTTQASRTSRLFTLVLWTLAVAAGGALWALSGSSFEGADGDLTAGAGTDWSSMVATPALYVGQDTPSGQNDDSLRGKEDDVVPGIDLGSIPSNKSDLLRFYVAHERIGAAGSAHDYLYLGWVRFDTLGTANMDFEFNQSSVLTANGSTVQRTAGDMLITYGFSGGGNPTLGLSRWTTTGPCEAASAAPCWGPIQPLAGFAEGAVNTTAAVYDPIAGVSLPALTFGEAAIDLTAANVFPADQCVSFGRGFVKSRSSNSFSASLKDFIKPIDVSVTNCGTVTIHKHAVPQDAQKFSFTASPELGTSGFDLDDDGNEGNTLPSARSFMGRFVDPLSVAETPQAGWDLTDLACSGPATVVRDAAGALTGEVDMTPVPGDNVDCTYTNTKRGRIRVLQSVAPTGDPQVFDFQLTGGPDALASAFSLVGGAPAFDSGSVRPGTYAVAQSSPGAVWDLTSATCDNGSPVTAVTVAPGQTVTCTFIDMKRGQIVVDETTVPAGDPQSFPFSVSGGPVAFSDSFSLTDAAAPHATALIRAGTYAAAQSPIPSGWDLTSAVCDDGSAPVAIHLDPGETVHCTFTHTRRGTIVIDEVTIPGGDPQVFSFALSGGPDAVNQSFGLADATAPHGSGSVKPGTYAVAQTPAGAAWDLSSATCDNGNPVTAVQLVAGSTVTCTFTNIKRGTINVDVVTTPSGDPQSFGFSLSGGPDAISQSFSLTDAAAPHGSGLVRRGTYAAAAQAAPAGWDLASATCSDGSAVGAIDLAAGESITCTFAYVKRGKVRVDVVTTPSADPQSFGFTLTGGPDAVNAGFGLTDASAPFDSGAVRAGTYAVTAAAVPAGWDLVSSSCDDGSAPAAVNLSAAETVTCTFSYVKRGHVRVDVVTTPSADPQSFAFTVTGGPDAVNAPFSLTDVSAPFDTGSVRPGTYAATAGTVPAGWDLISSSCNDGSAPSAINLSAAETVTCTFSYVKRGHVRVDVVTTPSADPQSFGFTLTGGPDAVNAPFSLTDAAAPFDSGAVRAGTFAVTAAAVPAGWDLASATCDDGSAPSAIGLSAAETVTCTFSYVKRGHVRVDVVTTPSGDPQSFGFTVTGGPDAVNAPFSLTDASAPFDSGAVRPGTYVATAGAAPAGWDLASATCSDGSAPSAIGLAAAETVTCTFSYVKRGTIHLDVVTTPSGDAQSFGFSLTGGPDAFSQSMTLTDASAPSSSGLVRRGTYVASAQAAPAGWDLASATCSDGSAVGAIGLDAGEDVTCTFSYVKRGHVRVDVVTTPSGDPQSFNFSLTGGPSPSLNASFSLTDASAPYDSGAVKAGTYAAGASSVPADWDLVSSTCDDGSAPASVGVAPGETVTCTFTFVKRGKIIVDESTLPAGDPQLFAFNLSGGPDAVNAAFSLADASAPYQSASIKAGTYAVSQTNPAGWDFTGATCSDGSAPGAVVLSPGEVVTCVFHNVKRGKILIDEVTLPANDPQSFTFTLNGGPDAIAQSFSLTDAAAKYDSGFLRPGTFAAAQGALPAGWELTSAVCSDGSAPGSIVLDPGEVVTCTFTNTKGGRVIIVEDARPDDPQDFSFAIQGPSGSPTGFLLDDDGNPANDLPNSIGFDYRPGAVAAQQADPGQMWDLTSVACVSSQGRSGFASIDLATRRASFTLNPGETVTCTFVDTKRGQIEVIKMLADPTPSLTMDPTTIPFEYTSGWGISFTLKHLQHYLSPYLVGGRSYTVAETPLFPYQASSVCVFPDGTRTTGGASIGVTPPPGAVVTCTFTNSLSGSFHPGSSGYWRNWRNHYNDAQMRSIMDVAFRGSPVYLSLFTGGTGALRADAIASIDAIYASGSGNALMRELTSLLLNLAVSDPSNPAVHALQVNDDITLDTKLNLPADVEALIRSLAPCDMAAGIRIGDLIDIAVAGFTGNVAAGDYRFDRLSSTVQSTLGNLFNSINVGGYIAVDPASIDGHLRPFRLGGPVTSNWYPDADGDGHGVLGAVAQSCNGAAPAGFGAGFDDCNDTNATVFPGAPELCDGLENDCKAANYPTAPANEADADHDGFRLCAGDCDDTRASVYPGAPELCGDGIRNNCNNTTWTIATEQDLDGDGYSACQGDCNDANPAVHPGAVETCNGVDDDCNGLVDDDAAGADSDGDGIHNVCDNCRFVSNTDQADKDHDGIGDACDVCPSNPDPSQADTDHDGVGDACDNCKSMPNSHQDDTDLDGVGDACDNCVIDPNPSQSDIDHDGIGDHCDTQDGLIYIRPTGLGKDYLEWQNESGYVAWNVYKGALGVLRSTGVYTQPAGSNALADRLCHLDSPWYRDIALMPAGRNAFYLVTGVTAGGIESSLGTNSAGVTRANTSPCP